MTEAVITVLEDLRKYIAILDHCGVAYGRSYKATLERLRVAVTATEIHYD